MSQFWWGLSAVRPSSASLLRSLCALRADLIYHVQHFSRSTLRYIDRPPFCRMQQRTARGARRSLLATAHQNATPRATNISGSQADDEGRVRRTGAINRPVRCARTSVHVDDCAGSGGGSRARETACSEAGASQHAPTNASPDGTRALCEGGRRSMQRHPLPCLDLEPNYLGIENCIRIYRGFRAVDERASSEEGAVGVENRR